MVASMKTKTVTIKVTKADIRDGVRGSVNLCPIALATKRKLGGYVNIASNFFESANFVIDLPARACNFISRFDKGSGVKPFSFKLNAALRK